MSALSREAARFSRNVETVGANDDSATTAVALTLSLHDNSTWSAVRKAD